MKRIEIVHQLSDNVIYQFFPLTDLKYRNLIADCVLAELEKLNFKLTNEYGEIISYEPDEGWHKYLEQQQIKDEARDFKVVASFNPHINKLYKTKSQIICEEFLSGKSIEQLAVENTVNRSRIVQIICKERNRYLKTLSGKNE